MNSLPQKAQLAVQYTPLNANREERLFEKHGQKSRLTNVETAVIKVFFETHPYIHLVINSSNHTDFEHLHLHLNRK